VNRRAGGVTRFEQPKEPLLSRRRFALRLGRAALLWCAMTLGGLAIGMAGYGYFGEMGLVDSFVNAAMILSGMGPVGELKGSGAKLFAGTYAIFSGLLIVIASGFVLAPIVHRVLHAFHVEQGKDGDG
jgi:hypothetical protein